MFEEMGRSHAAMSIDLPKWFACKLVSFTDETSCHSSCNASFHYCVDQHLHSKHKLLVAWSIVIYQTAWLWMHEMLRYKAFIPSQMLIDAWWNAYALHSWSNYRLQWDWIESLRWIDVRQWKCCWSRAAKWILISTKVFLQSKAHQTSVWCDIVVQSGYMDEFL